MTVDERVAELMGNPWMSGNAELVTQRRTELIRDAIVSVARDQKHSCAEAVLDSHADGNFKIDRDRAHQAVINAQIE